LYFANSCSKSIQYCAYNTSDNIACLFVTEVALGRKLKKKHADCNLTAENLPKKYDSVWGMGRNSFESNDEYEDNVQIPHGKIKSVTKSVDRSLMYDEFIVYHEEQIKMRYIIMLKIN